MRRISRCALLIGVALCVSVPASASSILDITLTGTIGAALACTPSGGPLANTCQDPNLATGDTFTLTAAVDTSLFVDNGDGTETASVYFLKTQALTTTDEFFQITAPGLVWDAMDNWFNRPQDSTITIQGNKVVGAYFGYLFPTTNKGPLLWSGDTPDGGTGVGFINPGCAYSNCYNTPGFSATWDFADSSVTGYVPEPGTWPMMILGFGLIGAALRRRYGAARVSRV